MAHMRCGVWCSGWVLKRQTSKPHSTHCEIRLRVLVSALDIHTCAAT